MTPYVEVTSKLPRLTKPQRILLLALARKSDHRLYPHRHQRFPVRALVAYGYAVTQRSNGSYFVALTKAGWDRAFRIWDAASDDFEKRSARSIAVGAGPWPEVLRPLPLAPWIEVKP